MGAYAGRPDVIVLGLPRGGVPVANEIARAIGAPLDVFVVRKLGVPWHREYAMGAIASGGVRVLNQDVIDRLSIPDEMIEVVTEREQRELQRREQAYHPGRAFCPVHGRTVILVDDGVATGATMRAAIEALQLQRPAAVIVATPVASPVAAEMLREAADGFVCVHQPPSLDGVGRWYDDFTPTSDDEVRTLLAAGAASPRLQPVAGGRK